jgi:FlaA1/EpsC-like NDP-sugar epimerase
MMQGGEIFIPNNCKPTKIYDLAQSFATAELYIYRENWVEIIGLRPGEKLEEVLIDPEELKLAETIEDIWVIKN